MGNDAKATLRTVLEEDENLLFVPLTDDQLGLLFDNYPKIRAKYEFHDSNPIYFVLDQTTGRASIFITCRQPSFLYTAGDKLTKMRTLELITSMLELFLFLKDAPNRQKFFGPFATLKELTQLGIAAGLLDENTVVAASTVRGGLCGGLKDPRVVPKQAELELDRLREAPEQDRDPAAIKAAEEALREAIAAREKTRRGKSGGGKGGGAIDHRPQVTAHALQAARNNPNSTAADIAKNEDNHSKALALQQKAHDGKSGGGKGGGANDPRPQVTAHALQAARNNSNSTAADIAKNEVNHFKAVALQQKAHDGKSNGGANSRGKPKHGERQSHVLILRDENSGETCYSVTNPPMAYHLQHEEHLFKEFNHSFVTLKMKVLIDKIKLREGPTMELVVGTRGDEHVIKWFKGMNVKKGKTRLWLTVAEEVPKGIVQITH